MNLAQHSEVKNEYRVSDLEAGRRLKISIVFLIVIFLIFLYAFPLSHGYKEFGKFFLFFLTLVILLLVLSIKVNKDFSLNRKLLILNDFIEYSMRSHSWRMAFSEIKKMTLHRNKNDKLVYIQLDSEKEKRGFDGFEKMEEIASKIKNKVGQNISISEKQYFLSSWARPLVNLLVFSLLLVASYIQNLNPQIAVYLAGSAMIIYGYSNIFLKDFFTRPNWQKFETLVGIAFIIFGLFMFVWKF